MAFAAIARSSRSGESVSSAMNMCCRIPLFSEVREEAAKSSPII